MKSLYESILDIDDITSQDIPKVCDVYDVGGVYVDNNFGLSTAQPITKYFDWRKVLSYCKKVDYERTRANRNPGPYSDEFAKICSQAPALGLEQNIAGAFRMFVKKGVTVVLRKPELEPERGWLSYVIYNTKEPSNKIEISIRLKKK